MTKPSVHQQSADSLLFRYRHNDTITGVTRKTAKRMAQLLGLTETQTIHLAIARLAQETLSRYEMDNGALTISQIRAIRKLEPPGRMIMYKNLFS